MALRFMNYISFIALFFNSASAQSITFSLSTSQLTIADSPPWTMTGSLTMSSGEADNYQNDIVIQERLSSMSLCRFTYTSCSSKLLATPVDYCRCTRHMGADYSFFMRRQKRLEDSSKILEAIIYSNVPGGPAWRSTNTVTIPLMYQARIYSGSTTGENLKPGKRCIVQVGDDVTVSVEFPDWYSTAQYSLTVDLGSGNLATGETGNVTLTPKCGSTARFTLTTAGLKDMFTFHIDVPAPGTPSLSANPPDAKEGDNIELECGTSSLEDVTFNFLRDGMFYKTSTSGRVTILAATVGKVDVTVYTCTVTRNSLSSNTSNEVVIEFTANTQTITAISAHVTKAGGSPSEHVDGETTTSYNSGAGRSTTGISSTTGTSLILMTCASALVSYLVYLAQNWF